MLSFAKALTKQSTEKDVHQAAAPTDQAPIQKFRWLDFPSGLNSGDFTYQVETRYFDPDENHLRINDTATVTVTLGSREGTNFHVGFTRGYMSSQAYAREFAGDLDFRPKDRSDYLFDSAPYQKKWQWLGFHARLVLFAFLERAQTDEVGGVDAFIYDVDEPDFVRGLIAIGKAKPLRVILDDSKQQNKKTKKSEPKPDRTACAAALKPIIGQENILRTHFKRFAHDKVLILKDKNQNPISVLCGSANFSIRGLYVQGNSVIVIDDSAVAAEYADAFNTAWKSRPTFSEQPIAKQWFKFKNKSSLPEFMVSFAPHSNGEFALRAAESAVERAEKDVIFALMTPGGGNLIADLKGLADNEKVFTFGIVQNSGFAQQLIAGSKKNGEAANEISSFQPLDKVVPKPFIAEFSGGMGQTIHHKFVVVDFNGNDPCVYCGSSNLSSGGEKENGDNLLGVYDRGIATMYAIEGIRLADHYSFRDKLSNSSQAKPFTLQGAGEDPPWYADYYDSGTAKCRSRIALIQ
jgi:phosphatidylserine/phosphatidylglycerophosphate/cardiolipin synthase-like enzyme